MAISDAITTKTLYLLIYPCIYLWAPCKAPLFHVMAFAFVQYHVCVHVHVRDAHALRERCGMCAFVWVFGCTLNAPSHAHAELK